jgi:hypothetical protein
MLRVVAGWPDERTCRLAMRNDVVRDLHRGAGRE